MNALKVYSFYKKEVSLTHNSGVVESYFYPKQDYFTDVNSRPGSPPCALTGWLARSTTFFRVNSQSSEQSSSTRRWGTPASTSRNARKCRLPGQKALYWRAQRRAEAHGMGGASSGAHSVTDWAATSSSPCRLAECKGEKFQPPYSSRFPNSYLLDLFWQETWQVLAPGNVLHWSCCFLGY